MSALEPVEVRTYRFHTDGLDPIIIYVEQYGPSSSRMTVQCYARAWTAYWGSHGNCPVEDFVIDCHADYITDNLMWGLGGTVLKRLEKSERAYVIRIAQAIKDHFSARKGGAA